MRISGTTDTGWIPIDLAQVARAIAAGRRRAVPRRPAAREPEPRTPERH